MLNTFFQKLTFLYNFFFCFLISLIIIIFTFISVAALTLFERQGLATIQRRKGPNVVGVFGLLQPISDGIKLFIKQLILVSVSDPYLQYLAPFLALFLALIAWILGPDCINIGYSDYSLALIFIIAITSTHVYGVLLAGWSSNSKYAYLGALRSVAQMVSYELTVGFCICTVATLSGSFRIHDIISAQEGVWFIFPVFPVFLIYCVAMLAETNRHPFDLPEADPELVAGHMTEYSGFRFAMFFLGEYANMFLMSILGVSMFLGGGNPPFFDIISPIIWFSIKVTLFTIIFILARAALPRYRYDQLMYIGWFFCLPLSIVFYIVTIIIMVCFNLIY